MRRGKFSRLLTPDDMEVYYKDLISEEASLEKLIDDLVMVVQGADDFAQAVGAELDGPQREEILSRLDRLGRNCRRLQQRAIATTLAANKMLHRYPYSAAGFTFAAGLLIGVLLKRGNHSD